MTFVPPLHGSKVTSNEVEDIVTPTNRSAAVWKYFGFKKDSSGKLLKGDCAVCKQCRQVVAHSGGTINLQNHLWVNHPALYEELCSPCESSSSRQDTMDRFLHSFPSVGKLSILLVKAGGFVVCYSMTLSHCKLDMGALSWLNFRKT